MGTSTVTRLKPRLFYGWWLVLGGFVIIAYGDGVRDFVFGQLTTVVREEFDISAEQFGLISLSGFVGSVALLAIGPLIDRFGPRWPMLIGISMAGIGFAGIGLAQNFIGVAIINAVFIGLGMSAGFLLPVQTAAANWFNRKRSMALAIVSAATVAGGAVALLLEQSIAGQFPWRGTFQVLGILMLIVGVPLALVFRQRPEPCGYLPDGEVVTTRKESTGTPEVSFTLWQALQTRTFWVLAGAMALANWLTMVNLFRATLLTERGISHAFVSLSYTITPFMGLVGILLFGFLGDRYPKRYLLALAVGLQSLSVMILLIGGPAFHVILFPLVFGLGSGTIPLTLAIRADYFGRGAFATITVAANLITGIIGMSVAFLSSVSNGWLYDASGSFVPTLLLSLLVGLVAATIFFFARPPAPPQQASTRPAQYEGG